MVKVYPVPAGTDDSVKLSVMVVADPDGSNNRGLKEDVPVQRTVVPLTSLNNTFQFSYVGAAPKFCHGNTIWKEPPAVGDVVIVAPVAPKINRYPAAFDAARKLF